MASMKTCANGHKFDSSLGECPFCPKKGVKGQTLGRPLDATVPMGGQASSGKGETVQMDFTPASSAPVPGATIPVMPRSAVASAQPPTHKPGETVIYSTDSAKADAATSAYRLIGWLVSFTWEKSGQDWRVREGKTRIGSGADNDIVLKDQMASARHAELLYKKGVLKIKDQFSTNGTVVNGEDIGDSPQELRDGDKIVVGSTEFMLRLIGGVPDEK